LFGSFRRAATHSLLQARTQGLSERDSTDGLLREKEQAIVQLNGLLKSANVEIEEATVAKAVQHEAAAAAKREAAESAEAHSRVVAELRADLDEQQRHGQTKVAELQAAGKAAAVAAAEKSEALADQLRAAQQALETTKRRAQVELDNVQTELDDKLSEIENLSGKLSRAERLARTEVADRDDAIAEIEGKASEAAAQREAAHRQQSELRSQLRQLRIELDEARSTAEQLEAVGLQRQRQPEDSVESAAVADELRQLLDQKTQVAELRHAEHDKMRRALEAKIAQQAGIIARGGEPAGTIERLNAELRQRERSMAMMQSEKDAALSGLRTKVSQQQSELASGAGQLGTAKRELQESKAEALLLAGRLEAQGELFANLKEENAIAAGEFKRLLDERNGAEQKRVSLELAARLDIERQNKGLLTQLKVISAGDGRLPFACPP
jgi:chromosome segregation ATPase